MTFGQSHSGTGVPHQQTTFGQIASKEHPMPVLVGHLANQTRDLLGAIVLSAIANGSTMRPQSTTEGPLLLGEMGRRLSIVDTDVCQRGGRAGFRDLSRRAQCRLQLRALFGAQRMQTGRTP